MKTGKNTATDYDGAPPRGRPFGGGGVYCTLRKGTATTCVSYPVYFAIQAGHKKKEPAEVGLLRSPP